MSHRENTDERLADEAICHMMELAEVQEWVRKQHRDEILAALRKQRAQVESECGLWKARYGAIVKSMRLDLGIPMRRFCLDHGIDAAEWSALERGLDHVMTAWEALHSRLHSKATVPTQEALKVDYEFIRSFGIDVPEFEGTTPHRAFVLGVEWGMFFIRCRENHDSFKQLVHADNERRLLLLAEEEGRVATGALTHDDWVEVTVSEKQPCA